MPDSGKNKCGDKRFGENLKEMIQFKFYFSKDLFAKP